MEFQNQEPHIFDCSPKYDQDDEIKEDGMGGMQHARDSRSSGTHGTMPPLNTSHIDMQIVIRLERK